MDNKNSDFEETCEEMAYTCKEYDTKRISHGYVFTDYKEAATWAEKCQRALDRNIPEYIKLYQTANEKWIVEIFHFEERQAEMAFS